MSILNRRHFLQGTAAATLLATMTPIQRARAASTLRG